MEIQQLSKPLSQIPNTVQQASEVVNKGKGGFVLNLGLEKH